MTRRLVILIVVFTLLAVFASAVYAAERPPLRLHSVEGTGGIFSTLTAYLANPPRPGQKSGQPNLGLTHVSIGNGRNLEVLTVTDSSTDRLEIGYSCARLDLADLPTAIESATSIHVGEDAVTLQQINTRYLLLKENEKIPALTLGVHYKTNSDTNAIDRDLGGILHSIGVTEDSGWDATLYGSKLFTQGKKSVLVNLGLRNTNAAHTGLLGFTKDRSTVLEGSVIVFATSNLLVGAEYRQKPSNYTTIPGLVGSEGDWWTLVAAYIIDSRTTISGGYAHFGTVLNHDANNG